MVGKRMEGEREPEGITSGRGQWRKDREVRQRVEEESYRNNIYKAINRKCAADAATVLYRLYGTEGENASSAVRIQPRYPANATYPDRVHGRVRKGLNVNEQKIGILIPQVTHRAVNPRQVQQVCTGCPAKTRHYPDATDLRPKSPRSSRGRGTSLPGFLARPCPLLPD